MRRRLIDLVRAAVRGRGGSALIDVRYTPERDGDPDPGEVVWAWVPFEDDPAQGKDRPVVVIGHRAQRLAAVALTSRERDDEPQFTVGSGPWDREGRPSYARLERLLDLDAATVRREGAALPQRTFDALVAELRRHHPGAFAR